MCEVVSEACYIEAELLDVLEPSYKIIPWGIWQEGYPKSKLMIQEDHLLFIQHWTTGTNLCIRLSKDSKREKRRGLMFFFLNSNAGYRPWIINPLRETDFSRVLILSFNAVSFDNKDAIFWNAIRAGQEVLLYAQFLLYFRLLFHYLSQFLLSNLLGECSPCCVIVEVCDEDPLGFLRHLFPIS
jgi:hypothetical protein